jgi:hypothetical protein
MRRPSAFKKTDITRAARGVLDAGLDVNRVEINKDGGFTIIPGKPTGETPAQSDAPDEWQVT